MSTNPPCTFFLFRATTLRSAVPGGCASHPSMARIPSCTQILILPAFSPFGASPALFSRRPLRSPYEREQNGQQRGPRGGEGGRQIAGGQSEKRANKARENDPTRIIEQCASNCFRRRRTIVRGSLTPFPLRGSRPRFTNAPPARLPWPRARARKGGPSPSSSFQEPRVSGRGRGSSRPRVLRRNRPRLRDEPPIGILAGPSSRDWIGASRAALERGAVASRWPRRESPGEETGSETRRSATAAAAAACFRKSGRYELGRCVGVAGCGPKPHPLYRAASRRSRLASPPSPSESSTWPGRLASEATACPTHSSAPIGSSAARHGSASLGYIHPEARPFLFSRCLAFRRNAGHVLQRGSEVDAGAPRGFGARRRGGTVADSSPLGFSAPQAGAGGDGRGEAR